ncbi:MAG: nucleotidyl transferase AbiEii/AbiGii toxin family protein [Arcobacteraceae bacterium]
MTSNVIKTLDKIKDLSIFQDELYFVGGTALSYFINHRISEDIDIISPNTLDYRKIVPTLIALGAKKIEDENTTALRLAGLFPEEYILKFILEGVKIEFFQANRPIQKKILQKLNYQNYKNSNLKILDLKSIAKLKVIALLQREKSRDLFDFYSILENNILAFDEILSVCSELKNITSKMELLDFLIEKKEAKDDESVYLNENEKVNLSFIEIKERTLLALKNFSKQF